MRACTKDFNTADSWETNTNTVAVGRFVSAEMPYVHICLKMGRNTSVVKISGTNSYCITSRLYLDCGELTTLSVSCVSAHWYMFCVTMAKRVDSTYRQRSLPSQCIIWCLLATCLKHFSFWEKFSEILPRAYIGLHVKCLFFLSQIKLNFPHGLF